jgi:hypothetical protein
MNILYISDNKIKIFSHKLKLLNKLTYSKKDVINVLNSSNEISPSPF